MLKLLAASTLMTGSALLAVGTQTEAPDPLPVAEKLNIIDADASALVTVDFKGGTLAQYIDAIRAAQPAANIVFTDEAGAFRVPPVNLRNAQIFEAVGLLDKLRTNENAKLGVDGIGDTYAISAINTGPRVGEGQTRVMSVASLLQSGTKEEDLLSAIDATLQTAGSSAAIKFHRETSLIIARGSVHDIDAVQGVLVGLRDSRNAVMAVTTQALNQELEALRARVEALEKAQKPAGN